MTNFETIAQTYVDNIVKYLSAQPFEMPASRISPLVGAFLVGNPAK